MKNLNNNKIKELYDIEGYSMTKIAKMFNCSKTAINFRLKKLGVAIKKNNSFYLKGKSSNRTLDLNFNLIKKYYLEGKNVKEISKEFNCSVSPIYRRLHNNNIKIINKRGHPIHYKRILKLNHDLIIKSYLEGESANNIAKIFGCSNNPIYRILRENNIKINKGGFKKGCISWCKGLTKEIDVRVSNKSIDTSVTRKRLFKKGRLTAPMQGKHHTKETKKIIGDGSRERMKNPEYRDKLIKLVLNSLMKRPTSYEQKISDLCIKNNLPFIYTGDGTFLIGHKNPDFVNERDKIAIEVYNDYFKIRDFGSCENYEKQRSEYFAKYGYKTIFIRKKHIENKNWKEICLNKINNYMKDEKTITN